MDNTKAFADSSEVIPRDWSDRLGVFACELAMLVHEELIPYGRH